MPPNPPSQSGLSPHICASRKTLSRPAPLIKNIFLRPCNYNLVILLWPHNHVYFVMSCSGRYIVLITMHPYQVSIGYLHISPHCRHLLPSISESHGSPKTNFTEREDPKEHLVINQDICFYTSDDLDPNFMRYTS